jgi:S1-C subfamily serine protease
MDGSGFSDLDDVFDALGHKVAGKEVKTILVRGGQRMELTVRIGERPAR